MKKKETKNKNSYSYGYAMLNCVPGWGLCAETFAKTLAGAKKRVREYYSGGQCEACKIVRVRLFFA